MSVREGKLQVVYDLVDSLRKESDYATERASLYNVQSQIRALIKCEHDRVVPSDTIKHSDAQPPDEPMKE